MERRERIVVVVGAGIAGLAVARALRERSCEVVCLEAAERAGGNIRTSHEQGFACEWGPNGFLDGERATLELVRALRIEGRLLPASAAAAKRFVFRQGRLRELPGDPGAFVTSDVLSLAGKLRVLAEPLRGRAKRGREESVYEFAARRLGKEAASVLVDAMVSGIHAGDARRLSLRSAFPLLAAMEAEHGSLTRALLARRKGSAPRGRLTSFREGMQELVDALARTLGGCVRLRSRVRAVSDMGVRGFRLHMEEGAPLDVAVVVLTTPAWTSAEILAAADPELAGELAAIPSAPVAVVHMGFHDSALGRSLDGFGFLVPRGQGPRILGTLWTSSIFPGRAPRGMALLTSMVGGATDPEAVRLSDEDLVKLVRADLASTMGVPAAPVFVRIFRHPRGIPQYTLGHEQRLAAIERRLELHPGLFLGGNSYRGVSVNQCLADAAPLAERALAALARKAAAFSA